MKQCATSPARSPLRPPNCASAPSLTRHRRKAGCRRDLKHSEEASQRGRTLEQCSVSAVDALLYCQGDVVASSAILAVLANKKHVALAVQKNALMRAGPPQPSLACPASAAPVTPRASTSRPGGCPRGQTHWASAPTSAQGSASSFLSKFPSRLSVCKWPFLGKFPS